MLHVQSLARFKFLLLNQSTTPVCGWMLRASGTQMSPSTPAASSEACDLYCIQHLALPAILLYLMATHCFLSRTLVKRIAGAYLTLLESCELFRLQVMQHKAGWLRATQIP